MEQKNKMEPEEVKDEKEAHMDTDEHLKVDSMALIDNGLCM